MIYLLRFMCISVNNQIQGLVKNTKKHSEKLYSENSFTLRWFIIQNFYGTFCSVLQSLNSAQKVIQTKIF